MNEYWGQYWGEMTPITDIGSGVGAVERTDMSRLSPLCVQSMKKSYELRNTDNKSEDKTEEEHNLDDSVVDDIPIGSPIVLHSIKLLQFLRQLDDNNSNPLSRDSVPQLIQKEDNQLNCFNVSQLRGRHMNGKAVKELLRRSVIIIAVFYGYEYMSQSAVNTLVDILSEYLSRFCQTLRTTNDSLELKSENDFIDVLDRVFHDMNVSNFESLRQFDSDLNNYNQNLMKEVFRKIGINESMNSSTKMGSNLSMTLDTNCDNLTPLSANSQSETKDTISEPTLSLKSLLSSFKSDEIHENEQLFGLTSPSNSFNKTID